MGVFHNGFQAIPLVWRPRPHTLGTQDVLIQRHQRPESSEWVWADRVPGDQLVETVKDPDHAIGGPRAFQAKIPQHEAGIDPA